jgi:hypothetical protein
LTRAAAAAIGPVRSVLARRRAAGRPVRERHDVSEGPADLGVRREIAIPIWDPSGGIAGSDVRASDPHVLLGRYSVIVT